MDFVWLVNRIYSIASFIKILEYKNSIYFLQKGDNKLLCEDIKTADDKSDEMVMGNTIIAHRWDKKVPLNKSHDIKFIVLQVFMITKDKTVSRHL